NPEPRDSSRPSDTAGRGSSPRNPGSFQAGPAGWAAGRSDPDADADSASGAGIRVEASGADSRTPQPLGNRVSRRRARTRPDDARERIRSGSPADDLTGHALPGRQPGATRTASATGAHPDEHHARVAPERASVSTEQRAFGHTSDLVRLRAPK